MTIRSFIAALLAVAVVAGPHLAWAAPPERALAEWAGPKTLLLRTDRPDPVADPAVQRLLATLLDRGYRVRLGAPGDRAEAGLIGDLRAGEGGDLLVITTAGGEVLALGPPPGTAAAAPTAPAAAVAAPPAPRPPPTPTTTPWSSGPVALDGPVRGVAVLAADAAELRLALLADDGLRAAVLSARGLDLGPLHPAPSRPARGLYLTAGDVDADGRTEVAAVWAEDVQGVYTGTDSRLHGLLLRDRGEGWEVLRSEQGAHLRVVGGRALRQDRGPHRLFEGPVRELGGDTPAPWAGADLLGYTPLTPDRGLGWDTTGRLQLVATTSGTLLPGGLLLEDLGPRRPPAAAVALEDTEYRSGFEKEDRVGERWVLLPPKVLPAGADAAYTLHRGRRAGLPLIGRPEGRDAVVRVRAGENGLHLEHPFPPVSAFVVDFDVVRPAGEAAVLLLADHPDGGGQDHLLVQAAK